VSCILQIFTLRISALISSISRSISAFRSSAMARLASLPDEEKRTFCAWRVEMRPLRLEIRPRRADSWPRMLLMLPSMELRRPPMLLMRPFSELTWPLTLLICPRRLLCRPRSSPAWRRLFVIRSVRPIHSLASASNGWLVPSRLQS
jgi:hypothetical protein